MKQSFSTFGTAFLKGILLGGFLLVIGGYSAFRIAYYQRVIPGVYVGSTNLSGMSANEALFLIHQSFNTYTETYSDLKLNHGSSEWLLPLSALKLNIDDASMKQQLLSIGKSGSFWQQLTTQYQLLFRKSLSVPLTITLDRDLLTDFIATTSAGINNPAIPPSVYVDNIYHPETNSFVAVNYGSEGEVVLQQQTLEQILSHLTTFKPPTNIALSTDYQETQATQEELDKALARALKLSQKSLDLSFKDQSTASEQTWKLEGKDLVSFIMVTDKFDLPKIDSYIDSVVESVNRPSQNALFQFNELQNRVVAFKPARPGLEVSRDSLSLEIRQALEALELDAKVPPIQVKVVETEPEVNTGSVNDLGIETLLGKGESTYYHSSASRKHNVELAASKLNGILIPPGEMFSFNEHIGEISLATGFQQAFVIRDGRTLLGDGGGVCQDSTTLFRAVLNAGLPITSWQNHSYRVGYYEQNSKPGFDATVYSPAPDFIFKNDTPSYILIQTNFTDMQLTYELYGTSDGRTATISNYTQWDSAPPPPDLHQDDPTLPMGTVKKVESAVPGLKTKFDYTVTRDNEVIFQKTFLSVFRPWQAVYLHGTKQ